MKLKILFTIITVFLMLLLSSSAFAQPCSSGPPCVPDCPADQFGPYSTIDVAVAPGCTLRITYASRIACGIWYDYYLAGVQFLSVGSCPFPTSDVKATVEAAMAALLDANPSNFPPLLTDPPGTCNTNWRAGKGACWEQNGDCIVPCTPLACCLNAYRVCIDNNGDRVITPLGVIGPPPGSCPIASGGSPCVDVCN